MKRSPPWRTTNRYNLDTADLSAAAPYEPSTAKSSDHDRRPSQLIRGLRGAPTFGTVLLRVQNAQRLSDLGVRGTADIWLSSCAARRVAARARRQVSLSGGGDGLVPPVRPPSPLPHA